MKSTQSPSKSFTSSLNMTLPNLQSLITNPIPQSQYPNLQLIIKSLNDYMGKCVKNRQYLQAQKAKDKIQQAYLCIKNRNASYINDRMKSSVRRLEEKQEQERQMFIYEWDLKIRSTEQKFNDQIEKKKRVNEEQIMKVRDQVQLALPISFSPDERLKSLRHQQKHLAALGKFLEAQKIKDQIQSREMILEERHKLMRQANIKAMVQQLQQRHDKDLKQRLKHKKNAIDDIIKQRNKKLKEMQQRHSKQIREIKWIHNEEVRMTS